MKSCIEIYVLTIHVNTIRRTAEHSKSDVTGRTPGGEGFSGDECKRLCLLERGRGEEYHHSPNDYTDALWNPPVCKLLSNMSSNGLASRYLECVHNTSSRKYWDIWKNTPRTVDCEWFVKGALGDIQNSSGIQNSPLVFDHLQVSWPLPHAVFSTLFKIVISVNCKWTDIFLPPGSHDDRSRPLGARRKNDVNQCWSS